MNPQIEQTSSFVRIVKKLHKQEKSELDSAVKDIMLNPFIGETKKGDLAGVRVYKFKMNKSLMLLAYSYDDIKNLIILYSLGSHENFYRDLKR